ncbi:peptide chain release factor 1 [Spongiactinospora rosea]|uniref:Peptide chain release factor 1 n=1 Tax=Spongiactinospora rosea TaxID=2248750 RepID=A0A366LVY6_9ACTN|nr:Vms1/Ankzf1 family peptidyl-tRNA hydrolase [Spongiactinospora rosea]RBQ17484.1 peptide chain release factor 1 [Spongiactinospora rosea]
MRLDAIRPLYDQPGPFASVYLDAGRSNASGAEEVGLRWRELRGHLAQESGGASLDAIEERVIDPGEAAPGRALFATHGEVALDEALPEPPRREIARWSALPHVMPLLAQRGESVPHVRVIADHTGADVIVAGRGASRRRAVGEEQDWPMTKTGQGGWSQKRYERGVEETWERNAMAVAEAVDEEVRRSGAELVVVGGAPKSRALVCEHLGAAAAERVVMAEHGSRAEGADPAAFEAAADAAVDALIEGRRAELLDRYGVGPSSRGLDDTVAALRDGRVEVLLVADDQSADGLLWIGEEGAQLALEADHLRAYGVAEPVRERADAALVRAAATTDAELWFAGRDALGTDVAALLRY